MQQEHLFLFESGNLALDLLNTRRATDDMRTPAELQAWLTGSGLTPGPFRSPPVARTLLTEAHRLRDDIGRLLSAHKADEVIAPHLVYGINRILAAGPTVAVLRMESEGARLTEIAVGEDPLAALAPVARAAAELIDTSPDRVRRCASGECSRWFIDTSKGGRRRWCSMATCGNRAKAARHRRRASPR